MTEMETCKEKAGSAMAGDYRDPEARQESFGSVLTFAPGRGKGKEEVPCC